MQSSIGIWLTDKSMIANELRDHYSRISRSTNPPNDSSLPDVIEPCITSEENAFLIHPPTDEEIKAIVWQMQPWISPGPDGYPLDSTNKCGMLLVLILLIW